MKEKDSAKINEFEKYWTQAEVAKRLRKSEGTIKNWREQGLLSFFRPPGSRSVLYLMDEVKDIGWVQNMLGHSSLQMVFTRYYAWIPKKTRNDGSAFVETVVKKSNDRDDPDPGKD